MNKAFIFGLCLALPIVDALSTLICYRLAMSINAAWHEQGPVIDRAHLDRMTGGDHALTLEVLGLFRQQMELWSKLLQPDVPTEDWGDAAHSLKGAARGIGAWALGEVCGLAEAASRDGPLSRDQKRAFYEDMTNHMQDVMGAIAVIEHQIALASLK
jgi:HPt (histidine-containing phosphotransfer) domain-containing protein